MTLSRELVEVNDSLVDDAPFTMHEAITMGLQQDCTHVLECTDNDGELEYVLVRRGECVGTIEKACWRASYHVECVDLDELRKAEAES